MSHAFCRQGSAIEGNGPLQLKDSFFFHVLNSLMFPNIFGTYVGPYRRTVQMFAHIASVEMINNNVS